MRYIFFSKKGKRTSLKINIIIVYILYYVTKTKNSSINIYIDDRDLTGEKKTQMVFLVVKCNYSFEY